MRRLSWLLLLFPIAAFAQRASTVSVVVPVVASTVGPFDTLWKTDVVIYNDLKNEATVALTLPTAPDEPAILLTIPGGRSQRFTDVVGEAFGLENVLSPLVVQTLGPRSVRVVATAYGIKDGKPTTPQPVPVTDASSFYQVRTLSPISYSDSRRTNVGLVNLGSREAVMTLALRGPTGQVVGGTRSVLAPNTMTHLAIQLMFPAMIKGDNYSLLIETAARDTYVYASVVDNQTSQAQFIAPLVGSR